jgi:hypothetical protein
MSVGFYGYALFQAERCKTAAELRAEDARRGELAAALSRAAAVLTAAPGRPFRWRRAPAGLLRPTGQAPGTLCQRQAQGSAS